MAESVVWSVTLEDVGDLPQGTVSPYRYFVSGRDFARMERRPLFCNRLPLPPMWEVREFWSEGSIWDTHGKRAELGFFEPVPEHFVNRVDWLDDAGRKRRVDHYDCYGCLYCSDYYLTADGWESRTYFDPAGRAVVTVQPARDSYALTEGEQTRFFTSAAEFLRHFRDRAAQDGLILAEG